MKPTYEDLEYEIACLREQLETNLPLATRLQLDLGTTPKESAVLALLLERLLTVSRDAIYSRCFEYPNGDGPGLKIIDVYICKLRTKLRQNGLPDHIESVRGYGYRLSEAARIALADRFMVEKLDLAA